VNAKGWTGISGTDGVANGGISGTYTQAAGSNLITITLSGHWLPAGGKAWLDFESPVGTAVADGVYTAITSDSTTGGGSVFRITAPDISVRSGRVRMVRFQGSYSTSNSGLAAPQEKRITLDTTSGGIADHHLTTNDHIFLNFTAGNPMPVDFEAIITNTTASAAVPDPNTFTVLTNLATAGTDSNNGMWMFPLVSQPMARSGTVNILASTFNMGSTETDLDQTPLNSPTVFNFFLPDYKFSGTLASQGLTTPEFQGTADTTVIRAGNFIYNGIFNPSGSVNGISSFKSGTHALVLDFSPWMGNASNIGLGAGSSPASPWTHNNNMDELVDKLNTLLGGQLTAAAKTIITNFVMYERAISAVSTGNPCTVTTSTPHGMTNGTVITMNISGVTGGTFSSSINVGTNAITVTGASTFTVPINCTSIAGLNLTSAKIFNIQYNNTTPTDTEKRDRIRAVVHLILTSPDYTIQK
jgi:hypothetical protein